ncbi:cob(I)yrinic acid a,c-diamide adenosyltransferase [Desulfovirgula thermocuniculi]|uniref:cob(I)yrinic acid a,c-diamide adenosyltransferase n=1 Tax=Desulfovirgula thermocuniculi TaxID=348842 RepID=UPI00041281C6|nr:cob(I)yrinic acid a,c-diamide adenosyltransferase [Desulfovirgula thermocuniculi]
MPEQRGLVLVFTGNGKGKTTAALGMGLRAWGQGMKVLVLQFIKGGWKYGELAAAARLSPGFEIRQLGEGFTWVGEEEAHRQAARAALEEAKKAIDEGGCDLLILDEILYALKFGLVSLEEVIDLIDRKPSHLHLVLTGRDAPPEVIEKADLVTEMREVKHHYQKGVKAQRGIEF